ncbi:hypothetical protein SO802_018888 [Lithocarpus litseifolius]|uniref:Uncharacterized protein n=1 Tax=Lithocarpus litseifolius TaxID=425828 RepID=A0AAW2CRT8_9ROSI
MYVIFMDADELGQILLIVVTKITPFVDEVFSLEPNVRGLEAAEKKTESPVKEELSAVKRADRFRELKDLVQETPASDNGRAEELVQETPASSTVRKTRGTTLMQRIWSLPANLKIECGLNVRGQPIGESGQTFKRWLGTFCLSRALCPLVPVAWTRVPHKNKVDSWIEIEKRWIIDPQIIHPANQMNWAMHLLGELRRNRRTKLKKKCYPKDALKEDVLKSIPRWADTQDYATLVDYWFDPDTQTLINKNKRSRGFQKDIARSGPISFAQTADNMAKESGQAVERAAVFVKVYSTKDGSPISNTVKEKIDKMKEILNNGHTLQGERREGILWAKDDAFAQVMGEERPGRVRGVGFGPTPSGRSGANLPCYTLTPPSSTETSQRMTSLENSYQSLRDELAQSEQKHKEEIAELHAKHKDQIAEALAEAKRQSDAQHKEQMDEMMSRVRGMLDRLTPVPFSEFTPFPDYEYVCTWLHGDMGILPAVLILIYLGRVFVLVISGLIGTNMKTGVDESICSLWGVPCLFEALDATEIRQRDPKGPFRCDSMPIIDKFKDMGIAVMGNVESGSVCEGESMVVNYKKAHVKVLAVLCDEDKVKRAGPGENVRVRLSGVEDDILSGFVLSSICKFYVLAAIFTAGYKAVLHINAVVDECEIVELLQQIDPKTKKPMKMKVLFVNDGATYCCMPCSGKHSQLDFVVTFHGSMTALAYGMTYIVPETDGYDSDKNVEFSGGNVHLITTKESWDQKMVEASRDGKIALMKHAMDAMKELRIPAFLASVCALTTVIDLKLFATSTGAILASKEAVATSVGAVFWYIAASEYFGHLQLILSWPALHVPSSYTAGLIIRKARNYLVTIIAHAAYAQPMSQQTMGPLPILQQFTQVLGGLAHAQGLPISNTAHTACPHAVHKVTIISPLALVHAISQPLVAQCFAHNI